MKNGLSLHGSPSISGQLKGMEGSYWIVAEPPAERIPRFTRCVDVQMPHLVSMRWRIVLESELKKLGVSEAKDILSEYRPWTKSARSFLSSRWFRDLKRPFQLPISWALLSVSTPPRTM
jgi:hypothetical protein